MYKLIRTTVPSMLMLNQAAILALSAVMIFSPSTRSTGLHIAFKALFLVHCGTITFRALAAGHGTQSPEQMFVQLRDGRQAALTTTFERIACFAAVIATAVMALA